jgi:hypothetical protein
VQLLTRSLQFSLQSILGTKGAIDSGLMGDISVYFLCTGRALPRRGICTGDKDLSRTAGYFIAIPRKIHIPMELA